jgi:arylsulfatase
MGMQATSMTRRELFSGVAAVCAGAALPERTIAQAQRQVKPNIVFVLVDNLGWGEIGVYGGGILRGAATPRLDKLASEGLRLLNYNVNTECVPTRASLMTGRYAIRTGALKSPVPGQPNGLVRWEVTIAQLLSGQGYATALYGKWHLGDQDRRLPNDRGFDEWYGIPRTTNEVLFRSSLGYDALAAPPEFILAGKKGKTSHQVEEYNLDARRRIDTEITSRTIDFMRRNVAAGKPFYAYTALTQVHFPTLPSREFAGRTGNGDFADSVVETDFHVGQILDAIRDLGIEQNTVVVFSSDNGPEFCRPWQGTAGFWRGTYHTALEGSLRAPFIIRWSGKIQPGVSNEIVHAVDMFTTLAKLGGAEIPKDRAIDGVDQMDFFLGKQATSNREGFLVHIEAELYAVKWRNWKYHRVWLDDLAKTPAPLPTPYLFNLLRDPKEETNVVVENGWVMVPISRMISEFQQSVTKYPHIPPGTLDPYLPPTPKSLPPKGLAP